MTEKRLCCIDCDETYSTSFLMDNWVCYCGGKLIKYDANTTLEEDDEKV